MLDGIQLQPVRSEGVYQTFKADGTFCLGLAHQVNL